MTEDQNSKLTGFGTHTENRETLGKTITHVVLGIIILGLATAAYVRHARQNFAAQTLALEARPLLVMADIESLREAETKYNEIAALDSSNPYAAAGLAYIYNLLWVNHGIADAQENAIAYTNELAMSEAQNSERFASEILSLVGDSRLEEAKAKATAFAEKGGISSEVYWAFGLALQAEGENVISRENFRKAHDLRSNAPHYATALGDSYDSTNDARNARLYWLKAHEANSQYVIGAARAVLSNIRRGKHPHELEKELARLEAFKPEHLGTADQAALLESRAALATRENQPTKALNAINQAIQIAGETQRNLMQKGQTLLVLDKNDEAIKALKSAMTKNPSSTRSLYILVDAYTATNQAPEAIKLLDSQTDTIKQSPYFHVKLGKAYQTQKNFSAANKAFEQALELKKNYPNALLGLAISNLQQKKHSAAIKQFEAAVSARPKFPQVYENIGLMFIDMGSAKDGHIQLAEAQRQYRAQGASKIALKTFYTRAYSALKRRSRKHANYWRKQLNQLN